MQFGLFRFDPETGALTREGIPVRLQAQPARVLAMLVARPGEVVTRDELREAVWGSETFVDFERGLNFAIAHIRSALGDSAASPRFIETLPKRGYRFIAPVSAPSDPRSAGPAGQPVPAAVPAPRSRKRLYAAAVVAVIAGTAAAWAVAGRTWRASAGPG